MDRHAIPIVIASHAAHEPLVCLIPPSLSIRLRSPQLRRGKPLRLTRVAGSGPRVSCLPPDVARLVEPGVVELPAAPDHRLELEWDGGVSARSHDVRPALPLVLRW